MGSSFDWAIVKLFRIRVPPQRAKCRETLRCCVCVCALKQSKDDVKPNRNPRHWKWNRCENTQRNVLLGCCAVRTLYTERIEGFGSRSINHQPSLGSRVRPSRCAYQTCGETSPRCVMRGICVGGRRKRWRRVLSA